MFCALVFCLPVEAQTHYIISTIAGTGTAGFSGDGGQATAAEIWALNGEIVVDGAGNVYFADPHNHRVRKIATTGIITTVAGGSVGGYSGDGGPATAAELNFPEGVAIDGAGDLYIGDNFNGNIRKVSTGGIISTVASVFDVQHLACAASGNLYYNGGSYAVHEINTSGVAVTVAGDLSFGFAGDGGAATAAELYNPSGLSLDSVGNLYIADYGNQRIRKVNTAGIISTVAGDGSIGFAGDGYAATSAELYNPMSVCADRSGNLFIADNYNERIREVNAAGIITTIAGGGAAFEDGCAATASSFDFPSYVAVDGSGNIYINDALEYRIRKLSPDAQPHFVHRDSSGTTACSASPDSAINGLLAVRDSDAGQSETWALVSGPAHGTAAVSYTATSTGDTLAPAGLYYTATTGYTGTDSFLVSVTDCAGMADTTTIHVTIVTTVTTLAVTGAAAFCGGTTASMSGSLAGGVWSSSNTTVATVGTSSGIVTGVGAGAATISYTLSLSCGSATGTGAITVNTPSPIAGSNYVTTDSTITLSDTSSGGTWSSSVTGIATVSGAGVVTGVAVGSATITYTTTASGCAVTSLIVVAALEPTPNMIITIAGNGVPGSTGDGLAATSAEINNPSGVAVDGSGNVYIAEYYGDRIRKVNNSGIISTIAGNGIAGFTGDGDMATAAEIDFPNEMRLDGAGNIYFTDDGNSRVRKINSSGIITTIAGNSAGFGGDGGPAIAALLNIPEGVAVDAAGNIYISDHANQRIRKINSSGTIFTIAGNGTPGYSGDGGPSTAANLNWPIGVAVDGAGNLYIADEFNNRIRKINSSGIITTIAGNGTAGYVGDGGPATLAELFRPCDVIIDAWGNIFVDDVSNNRVREIDASGIITTIAGDGSSSYSGDGCAATAAGIFSPACLAVDNSGHIYISEYHNRVRKLVYDRAPFFTGGHSESMAVCENSIANSVNSLLAVMDSDNLQSEIWSVVAAPIHGSVMAAYTTTSTSDTLTPSGLYYTPAAGYIGNDSFKIRVIDCMGMFDTTTIHVAISLPPPITGTASLCAGTTTALSDVTTGGSWSSGSTAIATVGSSTGLVTGAGLGTSAITYTTPIGCVSNTIVTVNSLSTPITGAAIICGGATTTLSDAITGGAWSSSSASVASVNITSGLVTGGSVSAVSRATITYNALGGCTTSLVVTVNPQPGAISGASSLCAGAAVSLTSGPSGGSWSSSNTAVATIGTTGIVGGVAGGAITVTYTLPAGCSTIFPMTVDPQPSLIVGTTGLCIGTTTTLIDATTGGDWTSGNTAIAAIDPLSGVLSAGSATGTSTISYTLGSGCAATAIVTVSIGPLPISGTLALCSGATTVLSDGVGGGAWSSDDTGIATVDPLWGTVYGLSTGTAIISYTFGTCSVTTIVTVNASPPAIRGVTELCVGLATLLSDATTGGTWSSSNVAVASVVGATGILTGGGGGTATISYTLPDGCAVTTTETVNTTPSLITGNLYVCPGATTLLTDGGGGSWSSGNTAVATVGSTGIVGGITVGTASIIYSIGAGCFTITIVTVNPLPPAISGIEVLCAGSTTALSDGVGTWSSSNTSIATAGSASGIITGVSAGTATITYTASSTGCSAHTTLTINPLPLTITGTLAVCSGSTTILNDHTAGGVWSSGSTTIATIGSAGSPSTGIVTGITPGTSVITYTNSATGCATHVTLTIDPLPLTIGGTLSICVGATTTLVDATSGGVWTSSPGSIATVGSVSGIVSGVSAGTNIVAYTLPTGCARTAIITVNAIPGITGPTAECVGAVIGEVTSPAGGTWSPSSGAIATVNSLGSVTGVATGTTAITYTSLAGCKATTTITVSLSPGGIIGSSAVCAGDTTTLSDAIGGGVWSSSNTVAATVGSLSGTVTGVAVGTTIITYSLGSTGSLSTGCTVTKILTVNAAPAAITGTMSMCAGATTVLTDATMGGAWSSSSMGIATVGSASSPSTGIVTGGSAGIDTITYTHGGCSVNTTVTVNPAPLAITGTGSVCAGDSIALGDAVSGGVWSTSSGGIASIDATGNVTGVSFGTTTVIYSLGAGCSVTKIITVNPISAITGSLGMCLGTTTALSDATTGGTWSPVSGGIATVNSAGNVTGVTAGTTVITYTTVAGCVATAIVTVNLAPSAISGTLHVCAGATTALGNTTGGGMWVSSYTAVATVGITGIVNGIVTGTTTITYSLGSTGSLPAGCTVTAVVTVNAMPSGITGIMSMCAGTTTALVETSTGGEWSSGSTATATVAGTGMVSGVSGGTVTVSYGYATGCAATATVTINPLPALIMGTTHLCEGLTTTLTSATTGGSWSSGSTGVAMADMVLGIISGVAPGTAVITYALPTGCSTVTAVTINAAPAAITGRMVVCVGQSITLSDSSGGGVWSSTTGVAVVMPGAGGTGTVTGLESGTTTISYALGSAGSLPGCLAMAVVTVSPAPGIPRPTSVCAGSVETLTDFLPGGTWSSSNTAVATINDTTGIVMGVLAGTTVIVYSAGCTIESVLTVVALPGTITGTPEVCVGYTTTLADGAGGGVWSSGNTAIATITGLGVVNGVTGGPATISYTNTSTGCAATRLVTVVAVPPISGVPIAIGICAFSGTAIVSDAITGGTWTSTSVTVSTAGVVTPYSAGAASLTYTIPLGCYVTASFTVNPLPGPVVGISRFCRGGTVTLSDTTSGGAWSSSNSTVAPVNAVGAVNGLSAGTAIISYLLASGCMETETITVDSFPVAGTITGSSSVCTGATIVLADPSAGGVWSTSNTSASVLGGVVSGISAGVDTINYTISNTCGTASTTKAITVSPLPATFSVTGGGNYCAGGLGAHIGLSGSSSGITYQLYRGSTFSSSVTGTGIAADFGLQTVPGVYTVVAANTATGCTANMPGSATVTITPVVIPAVSIGSGTGDTVCAGSTVTFIASPLNGGSSPTYQWLVNRILIPGATSNLYTYTPINGDEVKTILISSAACATPDTVSDSTFMTVVTPVIPTVTISASPGTDIQKGQSDTLTAIISGGGPAPTYQWEINGNPIAGAIMASFTSSYNSNDTVTCIVSVGGICNSQGTDSVVILVSNVGVNQAPSGSPRGGVTVWPNPNIGEFTITGTIGTTDEEVSIEITDLPGQSIYKRNINAPGGKIKASVSLSNTLANGVYILRLASGGTIHTYRIVMER